jgi:photosystem II stability/assembly factor-like uncharacterized protein
MKYLILIISFLLLSIPQTYTQESRSAVYHPESNYWSIIDKPNYIQNTANSDMFSWQSVQSPTNAQILGIFFIDSLNGWASHNGNGSMRTTDSGFNWTLSSFNDTNFTTGYNGVFFINQNTGWCVGGAIQIRKTTNGGANWFKQYGPPEAGIAHSIWFFDENTGYIVGSKNYPYVPFAAKTTNSGNNWVELNASFSGAHELNKQYWFDVNTGWVAGYDVLLKTTDGGASFTNLYANVPPTNNGHNALLCIYFANQQTGWIGGSNIERHNLYITTNAGTNWTFQTNPAVNNSFAQINDVAFMTQDSGWAIHGTPFSGAIMFTSNAGANWVTEEGSNNWFQCISYFQRKKAWVGASGGMVWYTILSQPVGIENNNSTAEHFSLSQNYPNPFNPVTSIYYELPKTGYVKIRIFNSIGAEVTTLINGVQSGGKHKAEFDGNNFSSGVYFYMLVVVDNPREIGAGTNNGSLFTETKKMILLK